MEKYGFNWRIGRSWGINHPKHICYASQEVVSEDVNQLHLGVKYKPMHLPIQQNIKRYVWAVGYISSRETIKYGYLRVDFSLPMGRHLWPAIWLTDGVTWPPEIDIVEGWSGYYEWPICKPKTPEDLYKVNLFANKIFPGVHLGTDPEEHWGKSYRLFRGTPCRWIRPGYHNTCELIWTPEQILICYNGHKVANEGNPEILKYFNQSAGMEIHLNNYVTNDYTCEDYKEMNDLSRTMTTDFIIYDLKYDPDYTKYLKDSKYLKK